MQPCMCMYTMTRLNLTVPSLKLPALSLTVLPPSPPLFKGDRGAVGFFFGLVLCCLALCDNFLEGDKERGLGFLLGLVEKQTCLPAGFFLELSMMLVPTTFFLIWISCSTPLVVVVCSLPSEGKWSLSSPLGVLLLVRPSTIHKYNVQYATIQIFTKWHRTTTHPPTSN